MSWVCPAFPPVEVRAVNFERAMVGKSGQRSDGEDLMNEEELRLWAKGK